jgi:hypothetical protein
LVISSSTSHSFTFKFSFEPYVYKLKYSAPTKRLKFQGQILDSGWTHNSALASYSYKNNVLEVH